MVTINVGKSCNNHPKRMTARNAPGSAKCKYLHLCAFFFRYLISFQEHIQSCDPLSGNALTLYNSLSIEFLGAHTSQSIPRLFEA
jgi:hypothetical protein